jgi:hypothetical protein
MLEAFFVFLSFAVGRWMGIEQANSVELRAETWERRYNNLLPTTQTSFEE